MAPKMLKALKGSIKKWHNIVYHNGEDRGTDNCPLCQACVNPDAIFYWVACKTYHCPVSEATGLSDCLGSPYQAWNNAPCEYNNKSVDTAAGRKNGHALALAELEFLVTLLPEGEEARMPDGWIWYWRWE